MDAPKPFHLRDGGSDVLVKLTNYHPGWTKMCEDEKVCTVTVPINLSFSSHICLDFPSLS